MNDFPHLMFSFLVTVWIYGLVMLIRNNWVFKVRLRWIEEDVSMYKKTLTYQEMMLRVWSWSDKMKDWLK